MVHGFGDSFTRGDCDGKIVEKTFIQAIAQEYHTDSTNHGVSGCCFEDILKTITSKLTKIKKGDIVVVGGTNVDRMLFPVPNRGIRGMNSMMLDVMYKRSRGGLKEGGYGSKETYEKLYLDQVELLKKPFHDQYDEYFENWLGDFQSYFNSIGVRFYYWNFGWWFYLPHKSNCKCGHWGQGNHDRMAGYLLRYMEKFDSGFCKVKIDPDSNSWKELI
jgi:hypothetical protein